jgi:hypothetical protein
VAEPGARIWSAYAVDDSVYFVTGDSSDLQNVLWRSIVQLEKPELVTELPPATSTVTYAPFDGDLLVETNAGPGSVETFWTVPLDGGGATQVTELDARGSDTTRLSTYSALAKRHAYHAQEAADGGTHVSSVVIEVERP